MHSARALVLHTVAFTSIMCSASSLVAQGRPAPIIDGTLAPVSQFPYVAELSLDGFVCTGTLVGSRYILSAAHCFYDERNRPNTNFGAMSATLNGVTYGVSNVTIHPSYVPRSSACIDGEVDSAVMELSSEPSGITPISLQRNAPTVGATMLLVGFGTQGTGAGGEDGSFPPSGFVNYGSTTIESVDSTYVNWTFDTSSGEANTAGGDSGGPAFIDLDNARYVSSTTCGGTGNAGFETTSSNTRVDLIASWVDSITGSSPTGQAPAFVSLPSQTVGVNQTFSYTLQATGTAPLAISVTSDLPPGLTFDGSAISGTPTTVGLYTVSLLVSNSVGSQAGSLEINVMEFDPESALTFNRVTVSFEEDTDLVTMRGLIDVWDNFAPQGTSVSITIGELQDTFTLSRRGIARRRNGFDRVILRGRMRGGAFTSSRVRFQIGLGDNDSLYDELDQLFPIEAEDGDTVGLPVEIVINGITYRSTITMRYRATRGIWVYTPGS